MSVQSDEDDEYLAMVEGQCFRALAAIERVKALIGDPASPDDAWGTHSEQCYRWHAGCLAVAISAALEPTDQPKGKP